MSDVNKFIEPFGEGFTFVSEMNSLCSTLWWRKPERGGKKRESKGDLVDMEKFENERKLKEKDFWGQEIDLYIWLKNVGVDEYQLQLTGVLYQCHEGSLDSSLL